MRRGDSLSKKIQHIDPSRNLNWADAGVSKIDHYDIGKEVLDMRRKGMSYMKISKLLPDVCKEKLQGDTVSMITIRRYCKEHVAEEREDTENMAVNAYRENLKMLKMVDNNIEMLNVFLDSVSNMIANGANDATILKLFKHTKDLQVELEHYIARKQDIVSHIFNLQKEVYNMTTMNEVLTMVLNTVRKADRDIYNKVLMKLRENEKFIEATKKINQNSIE